MIERRIVDRHGLAPLRAVVDEYVAGGVLIRR